MEALAFVVLIGLLIFAVIEEFIRWNRRRQRFRPCPRCGRPVQVGVMECGACGFDFRTIGS